MKDNSAGMTLIVKTITRLTAGLIFIYGVFMVLEGRNGPGGGIAGGIIIALSFIHLMLAFGREAAILKLNSNRSLVLAVIGAGAFLILSALSFLQVTLREFLPWGEMALSAIAAAGLFAVFLALVLITGGAEKR